MADIHTYLYDEALNAALRQSVIFSWDAFFRSTEHNLFKVAVGEEGHNTITATDGECMTLHGTTPEQIVILFATVRGLKEAARE